MSKTLKALSMAAVFVMLAMLLPLTVSAKSDFEIDGYGTLVKYNGKDAKVTIPDSVVKIGSSAFLNCTSMEEVTIPDSVTEIHRFAFCQCTSLKEVTIPGSVKEIEHDAFSGCSSLRSVTISNGVKVIGYDAFEECESLTSVTLPQSLTVIGSAAFMRCSSLTSVNIPSSVTEIDTFAFSDCDSLKSVTIPDGVTKISDSLFNGCDALESVIIPDSVTKIDVCSFLLCSSLRSVTIPDGVTEVGMFAFSDCKSLESLTIPDGVERIDQHTFAGCSSLKSVIIPESVTEIGKYAFSDCASLRNLTIPASVTRIGNNAFHGDMSHFNSIYYTGTQEQWDALYAATDKDSNPGLAQAKVYFIPKGLRIENTVVKKYTGEDTTVVIPNGITYIGKDAFMNCTHVTEVTLPDTLQSISSRAFYGCTGLTHITIPASVQAIHERAFFECLSLKDVTLLPVAPTIAHDAFGTWNKSVLRDVVYGGTDEEWDNIPIDPENYHISYVLPGASVTYLGDFTINENHHLIKYNGHADVLIIPDGVTYIEPNACKGADMTRVIIPDSVTDTLSTVFMDCTSLKSVKMSANMTTIPAGWFWKCTSLTDIELPDGVTVIGPDAFNNCTSLKRLTIPNSVTQIEGEAFWNCKSLTGITIPSGVTELSSGLFKGCTSLKSIEIPAGVEKIRQQAFSGCTALTELTVPDGVTDIYKEAFKDCTGLKRLNLMSVSAYISNDAFTGCDIQDIYYAGTQAEWDTQILRTRSMSDMFGNATLHTDYTAGFTVENGVLTKYNGGQDIVMIPSTVKVIGKDVFNSISFIKEVVIPGTVTKIESHAFAHCTGLKSINLPNSITEIGSSAFINCSALERVDIPDSVETIGISAFSECNSLYDVKLPAGLTAIDDQVFSQCGSLDTVEIPESVTSIGQFAFAYCDCLGEIDLPAAVNTIGKGAFRNCGELVKVSFRTDGALTVGQNAFLNDEALEEVYYGGSQGGWQTITETSVASGNDPLLNATVTCKTKGNGLRILTQPTDRTIADGQTVSLSVAAEGEGVTYRWQCTQEGEAQWIDMAGDSASVDVALDENSPRKYIRCSITDQYGTAVESDTVILQLSRLAVTKQPRSFVGGAGAVTAFEAGANDADVSYQWQLSDDKGANWRNSSTRTAIYFATLSEKNNGRYVRCVMTDADGAQVITRPASMKISSLAITRQPVDATAPSGGSVTFEVSATGDGLTYQWQLSDDQGANWRNSSNKTATYVTTLSDKNNGRYVRCIVTDEYGVSVTSQAAGMTILAPTLAITGQPESVTALAGDLVTFKVTAEGDGLTYQWQLSDDQGANWRNSSNKTATYSTTLSTTNSGRYLRCVVSDASGATKKSNAAYMKISSLAITGQPTNASGKMGDLVTFTVTAKGPSVTYQWQLSDDKGGSWRNSSNQTAEYATTLSSTNNGRYVRCVVTDKYGNAVESDAASMSVNAAALSITKQPESVTSLEGKSVTFTVKATGDGLSYQWQLSDDQGANWRNSSVRTATYTTTLTTVNSGRYVRCIVSDAGGASKKSNAAYMKISSLAITLQPVNATGALGDLVIFNVTAKGPGITYQWQLSDDQGQSWRNSSNTTSQYATTLSDKNNGRYVRCVVTDKYGNSVKSNAASMKSK